MRLSVPNGAYAVTVGATVGTIIVALAARPKVGGPAIYGVNKGEKRGVLIQDTCGKEKNGHIGLNIGEKKGKKGAPNG